MLLAGSMAHFYLHLILLSLFLFIPSTHELQAAQTQVLLQLRKHLEYPTSLEIWGTYTGDFCNLSPSVHVSIKCQDNSVTELKIMGDKPVKANGFNGFAIPNQTLSARFSIDSFVTTLTRLANLRVLSLVSLGIWGPLSDKIHRLSFLEVLDLSSNFLFGSIPEEISKMVKLQTLVLEDNYFNGSMPGWFDSLSNLTVLSLKNNRLKGSFPSSLCRIKTLTDISLSHNELSGGLPDLSGLTGLRVLNLRENHLHSDLPLMPKGVVSVLLSQNEFSGKIPSQFAELGELQHLDLSSNHLSGVPPSALFALSNLSYLNLASNILSGSLPDQISCGSKLGFVDVSGNKLIGGLPSCLANTSDRTVVQYGRNCLSIDSQHQQRGSYCKKSSTGWKKFTAWKIVVLVAIVIVLVLALSVFGVLYRRRYHLRKTPEQRLLPKIMRDNSTTGVSSELLANARLISQAMKLGTQTTPICRLFSIEELREATKNFHPSTFIGEGSIGKLYKGKLENGSYVAIRALALSKKYSVQNLKARLDLVSKFHHPNLVTLLGHCIDSSGQDDSGTHKVHLVYEYVPNGNYRAHLSDFSTGKALKWSDRLAILIGVAKAVHFLHTGVIPGCFNNQLKTNNILLDEHRIPKLSDYGMSIIREEIEKPEAKGERSKSWYGIWMPSANKAMLFYQYVMFQLSIYHLLFPPFTSLYQIYGHGKKLEDDVYNFGFILFESLVGPIAIDKGETFFLNEKASFGSQDGRKKILDPVVLTTCCQESLSIAVSITTKCISQELSSRPSFEDVLWNLQYAAQVQATADADQKSDSTYFMGATTPGIHSS